VTTKDHTVRGVLRQLKADLAIFSEEPHLEAQVLLMHVLGQPKEWILAHPEAEVTPDQEAALERAIETRRKGTPLPYVIGHWEFFGLDFIVTPDTLIPRPETELMVETALDWLRQHPTQRTALDVGTGSGAIAISLADQIYDLRVFATDISRPALEVAAQNAEAKTSHGQVNFFQSDLAGCIRGVFNVICANLPYIPTATLAQLPIHGHEPTLALDGGPDGLNVIRRFLEIAPRLLAPGGLLLMELEAGQGEAAQKLAETAFQGDVGVSIIPDLSGLDRVLMVEHEIHEH
jgi:release factor glutamine methyltransferase